MANENNLIDLDSPKKLNLSYTLACPLIPSPSHHEASRLNVTEDPENNPFDEVLQQVVKFEQSLEDPYERVLNANVRSFDYGTDDEAGDKMSLANKTLLLDEDISINNIEIDFDVLPKSDDEAETEDNLIQLGNSPPEKLANESVTSIKCESVSPQCNVSNADVTGDNSVAKEFVELLESNSTTEAVSALLSLQKFINEQNNADALKIFGDLQKSLGINVDSNCAILSSVETGTAVDCNDHTFVMSKAKETESPKVTKINNNEKLNKLTVNKRRSPKNILHSIKNVVTKKAKDSVVHISKNMLNTAADMNNDKSKDEKKKSKSPIGKLTNSLRKSPYLKLTDKKSETSTLRRSKSMSHSPILNEKTTQSAVVTSKKRSIAETTAITKPSPTLKAQKGPPTTRPRLGTYTVQRASSASPKNLDGPSQIKARKSAHLPSDAHSSTKTNTQTTKEEVNFKLRRTSTLLKERPGSSNKTNETKMNETVTLQKDPVKQKPKTTGNMGNTRAGKMPAKATSDRRIESRPALSPLDNQNKPINKIRASTAATVSKGRSGSVKNKNEEKENFLV